MSAPQAALRTLTLQLPLFPAQLLPNAARRLHWAQRAELTRGYRAYCCVLVQANQVAQRLGRPIDPAVIGLSVQPCHGRRSPDADGALSACKPLIDSLVDAKVLKGDGPTHVRYGGVEVVRHTRGCRCAGFVRVQISERGA